MGAPHGIDIDVDREALAEFLDNDGGVEVLIAVSEGGLRYSKLNEKTRVAGSTMSNRRAEAVDLGLIEGEARETETGMENFYVLTPVGQAIRKCIYKERLGELHWRLLELEEQFEESSEEVIEWVADEDSALEDVAARMMMYEDLDEPRDDYRDYFWE
jgi:DNA-binding HxlR family transcriptional regulator